MSGGEDIFTILVSTCTVHGCEVYTLLPCSQNRTSLSSSEVSGLLSCSKNGNLILCTEISYIKIKPLVLWLACSPRGMLVIGVF